jgi:hypothetical protein
MLFSSLAGYFRSSPSLFCFGTSFSNPKPSILMKLKPFGHLLLILLGMVILLLGHVENVGAAAAGKQQYQFAYNSLGLLGTPDGEAFLTRQDGLLFPDGPIANVFDIADFPFNSDDDLFTVIWGRVDRDMYATGGIVTGSGEISSVVPDSNATPADSLNGRFEVQSATWPIPEPSSALLIMVVGFRCIFRRRK